MSSPPENSSADDSSVPADWHERLERVRRQAAADFRASSLDSLDLLRVCARYFQHGKQEGFDHGELIDYLGISTPSVLDMADFTDSHATKVMALLPLLQEDADGTCRAPAVLPDTPPAIPPTIQSRLDLHN
jgi:hypothetical protein